MYALLITRNDIIKNSFLKGSIDVDQIITFIRPAQDKYLINLLGTVLFNKMMELVATGDPLNEPYSTLLGHIKRCLIWYVVSEYIPFSSIQFKSEGAYSVNNEQFTSATKSELDYLMMKSLDNAEVYARRLQDYLCANSTIIPEYTQTTGKSDNIYPDKSNQFFSGINL